jgi:hypothetical protein
MADLDKAVATQLSNIEQRTGRSRTELAGLVRESGLAKHGELVVHLKSTLGMGHGDANLIVHLVKRGEIGADAPHGDAGAAPTPPAGDPLDAIYTGAKAALRPVHDRLMHEIRAFGPFEESPKKNYMSLRRRRQFAMIGPATNSQVEVGLNVKDLDPHDRLRAVPPGQMCNYKVRLGAPGEVDATLLAWIRAAYEAAA